MNKLPLLLAACSSALMATGQTALTYEWIHTWPFGQEGAMFIRPAEEDNHLAVDPTTGNVFITVDDMLQQASPRFDFLFTFSGDGDDLTPVPTPLLGVVQPSMMDPSNLEGTNDLVARNGIVYHTRELNMGGPGAGTTGSLCARNADDTGWKLGLGRAAYAYGEGKVLVDDQGAISIRSLNGNEASVQATSLDGWPLWTTTLPGVQPFQDAVILGDRIFGAVLNWIWEIDRMTGATIGGYTLPTGGSILELATDGSRLFFLQMTGGGGMCTWGCVQPDGTAVWSTNATLGIQVTELAVDQFGRPWFIGNDPNGVSPPLLVVTASDGSSYETFTYGATMNDLAMGPDQAYITGAVPVGTTYLIAIGTDLTTGQDLQETPMIGLFPVPAADIINLRSSDPVLACRAFTPTGQSLSVELRKDGSFDVGAWPNGIYFLEVLTRSGRHTHRFEVAR